MKRQTIISDKWITFAVLACLALGVYGMGIVHILDPNTRNEALSHTPVVLLSGMAVMLFYMPSRINLKILSVFLFIAVSGYIVEVIGVKTGLIFGHYFYGRNFGVKLLDTPLLIGVNWLFLVYASASVAQSVSCNKWMRILFASFIMLGYDIILEKAAPKMGLWTWQGNITPLANYMAWFIIALFYQWLLGRYKIETRNVMAAPLLIMQLLLLILVILFVP